MSNSQGKDKIYEELKGYFPPEYDLTPEELEKEIELENKKREIALGMMKTHLTEEKAELGLEATSVQKDIPMPEKEEPFPPPAPVREEEEPAVIVSYDNAASLPFNFEDIVAQNDIIIGTESIEFPEDEEELTEEDSDDETILSEYAASIENDDEIIVIPEADDVSENDLFAGYEPLNDLFDVLENEKESPSYENLSEKDESARKTVSWLFDFLEVFSICIACIIVVFALFFRLTKVSGESMEDTLFKNQYLVVSDLFYEPCIGDIVVIQNTSLTNEKLREPLVKRIIAVGGQSVDISSNGMVTLTKEDGSVEVLDQHYTKSQPYAGISGHYDVPEGYVFVMGDNRNHSTDSRSPLVGVVDERCIFGKAYLRILPFGEFTIFENPYKD